jgi:hypothetical protein
MPRYLRGERKMDKLIHLIGDEERINDELSFFNR